MNRADSTPLEAGGNGRQRVDSAYETCGAQSSVSAADPGVRHHAPNAEHDEADRDGHHKVVPCLRERGAANGGGDEHDAIAGRSGGAGAAGEQQHGSGYRGRADQGHGQRADQHRDQQRDGGHGLIADDQRQQHAGDTQKDQAEVDLPREGDMFLQGGRCNATQQIGDAIHHQHHGVLVFGQLQLIHENQRRYADQGEVTREYQSGDPPIADEVPIPGNGFQRGDDRNRSCFRAGCFGRQYQAGMDKHAQRHHRKPVEAALPIECCLQPGAQQRRYCYKRSAQGHVIDADAGAILFFEQVFYQRVAEYKKTTPNSLNGSKQQEARVVRRKCAAD